MSPEAIGNYRILGELGRGAMGIVYHAQDLTIGRPVAIKLIRVDAGATADHGAQMRQRLIREASAAGKLSHPGIVTVYQLGEEGQDIFVVMEYVPGVSLEYLLINGPSPDPFRTLDILHQIADALDYAHHAGIVHRDIKPANILVREDSRIKVADFGIAKMIASTTSGMTAAGVSLGSPAYMSPEQIRAEQVDGRSDQFALGIIAYQMLTGRMPFKADTAHALMYQIVSVDPFAAGPDPSLSPSVVAVLRTALAKDPKDRFPTCDVFVQQLAMAAGINPNPQPYQQPYGMTATAPMPPPPAIPSNTNKKTSYLPLILIAFVIFLAGIGFILYRTRSKPDTTSTTTTTTIPDVPLVKAVAEGRIEDAKNLLAKGADVNAQNPDGTTALMAAAEGSAYLPDNAPTVGMLLGKGAKVDLQDKRGRTALYRSASEGKIEAVKLLLAAQANPNQKAADASTPLTAAVTYGRTSVTTLLLDNGAQSDLADAQGSTPLMLASEGNAYLPNNVPLVEAILAHKPTVDAQDSRGRTALYRASAEGKTEVVRLLLDQTANPNLKANDGSTPLIEAVTYGRVSTVPILLAGGAQIDLADSSANTPLMIASEGSAYLPDNAPMVNAVLAAKPQIDLQDTRGRTALYRAAAEGKEDAIRLLLDKKANPNLKANDGSTPLIQAVTYAKLGAASVLLDRGADVNQGDASGTTPLMIAAEGNPYIKTPAEFLNLLLSKGARTATTDARNRTALDRATENKNAPAIEILSKR